MGDLAALAGRVLMVGIPSDRLESGTAAILRRLSPGGIILFARNLESPPQCASLLRELVQLSPHPLLLALDQEGGRVSRLERWVGPTPTGAALARAGIDETRRFGATTASALRAIGFNVDFAPVVDLSTIEAPNGIGDRSFGTDPGRVTELAGAFLSGLQERGVAGCLKHFPGLGPTTVDSHQVLPVVERDGETLRSLDLVPYRRLGSRAAAVMVGHGHYPALDPADAVPASLSSMIVSGLLRRELGFRGLIVSDDLEMGAVAPLDVDGLAAVRAIDAGCDLVLYCADLDRAEVARDALVRAGRDDPAFDRRLEEAARAVSLAAERWPWSPAATQGWDRARGELQSFAALV